MQPAILGDRWESVGLSKVERPPVVGDGRLVCISAFISGKHFPARRSPGISRFCGVDPKPFVRQALLSPSEHTTVKGVHVFEQQPDARFASTSTWQDGRTAAHTFESARGFFFRVIEISLCHDGGPSIARNVEQQFTY